MDHVDTAKSAQLASLDFDLSVMIVAVVFANPIVMSFLSPRFNSISSFCYVFGQFVISDHVKFGGFLLVRHWEIIQGQ